MATAARTETVGKRPGKLVSAILINGILALICLFWLVPTAGLLVSSLRERNDVVSTGWWTVFPHPEYISSKQVQLTAGLALDQPIPVEGVTLTDDQLRAGYVAPDGRKFIWANRRTRLVDEETQQWISRANFTLQNYQSVIFGQQYTFQQPGGGTRTEQGENMGNAFISSLTVAI